MKSLRINRIQSKVPTLAALVLHAMPRRPFPVARMMRVNDTVVAVGPQGRIYTTETRTWLYWATAKGMRDTIEALKKLNLLTAEAVAEHAKMVEADRAARDARFAAQLVLEQVDGAGLKLTAAQRRKLEATAKTPAA